MVERPRLKRDWVGRYVRLRQAIETQGGTVFRAGEVMHVYKNHAGLGLRAVMDCPHCKRQYRMQITGVHEENVELLPEDYTPAPPLALRDVLAWFAAAMEAKLRANDHKTGWAGIDVRDLWQMLLEELFELEQAIEEGGDVVGEAVDAANFCMMIADVAKRGRTP